MSQTANGVPTNYVLKLASGADAGISIRDEQTNLYGVNRIAQQGAAGKEYFLGDALGSVRQLAGSGGAVSLARSYQPYGKVLGSDGNRTSSLIKSPRPVNG